MCCYDAAGSNLLKKSSVHSAEIVECFLDRVLSYNVEEFCVLVWCS
jgi:hypothetical protein